MPTCNRQVQLQTLQTRGRFRQRRWFDERATVRAEHTSHADHLRFATRQQLHGEVRHGHSSASISSDSVYGILMCRSGCCVNYRTADDVGPCCRTATFLSFFMFPSAEADVASPIVAHMQSAVMSVDIGSWFYDGSPRLWAYCLINLLLWVYSRFSDENFSRFRMNQPN